MHIVLIGGTGSVGKEALTHFFGLYAPLVREHTQITLVTRPQSVGNGSTLFHELKQVVSIKQNDRRSNGASIPERLITTNTVIDYSSLSDADVIIVLASSPDISQEQQSKLITDYGMEHRVTLSFGNIKLMSDICCKINLNAPNAEVCVVTNQSDLMSMFARERLATERVIGFGGMVDTARFRYALKNCIRTSTKNPDKALLDAVCKSHIVGYHNSQMFLLASSFPEKNSIEKRILDSAITQARAEGFEITAMRSAAEAPDNKRTPHTLPGSLVADFMAARLGLIPPRTSSFNVHLMGKTAKKYGVPDGTELSVPVVISKDGYVIADEYAVSAEEQNMFASMSEEIHAQYCQLMEATNTTKQPLQPKRKRYQDIGHIVGTGKRLRTATAKTI